MHAVFSQSTYQTAMSQAPTLSIMDTTLRDGEQTQGVSFTVAEKVNIAKALLGELKVDRVEVASALISAGEMRAVSEITQWAVEQDVLSKVEILGFVDHKRSVDWIKQAGGSTLNLLTKGSEKHCREQLRKTLDEHLEGIKKTIAYAKEQGMKVNVYLEDWSNGYKDSPQYVYDMVQALADLPIAHVMLPDTLGVMTPDLVTRSLQDMVTRFPQLAFDFHPHNDYGLATANCLAAVSTGIKGLHCTMNCLGERAGNVSLAEVVVMLKDMTDVRVNIDESKLFKVSQLVENFSGKRIADNAPVVGDDVFTQTSGIHADGDKKGGLYQTALTPERFQRRRSYALGKMSGKASLQKNLDELGMQLGESEQQRVLARVVALGDEKARLSIDDLPFIVADVLETKQDDRITLLNCSINSGLGVQSTVSLRLRVDDTDYQAVGAGNGGFAAFIKAIDEVMQQIDMTMPELLDYQIRIPRGGQANALTECLITWRDDQRDFKTRGVNPNQVLAGVEATIRMLNRLPQGAHS